MRQNRRSKGKAAKRVSPRGVKKATRKPARRPARKTARKPAGRHVAAAVRKPARRKAAAPLRPARPARAEGAGGAKAKPARRVPDSPRVQKLRAMLEAKQAEIREKIRKAREESVDADRTSFAEVGDLVSASVEKEKAFESGEAGVQAMREIAGALEKLKGGTYGICERCGKPIGLKRLEIVPSATLCVKCKAKEEAKGKIVAPPADSIFED